MNEVWTVNRIEDNHVVAVYMNEKDAADWCKYDNATFYYYEHHEVN